MDSAGLWQNPVRSYCEQDTKYPVSVKVGEFIFQLVVLAFRGLCSNLSPGTTHIQEMLGRTYISSLL
jgi:hypothetical protein